jgi:hypothetical protein
MPLDTNENEEEKPDSSLSAFSGFGESAFDKSHRSTSGGLQ